MNSNKETKITDEKKYRRLFLFEKRWAKHWGNYNIHRAQNTHFMIEPAKIAYEEITIIDEIKELSNKEKINELLNFYKEMDNKEKMVEGRMMNHYYFDSLQRLQKQIEKVEKGEEIIIRRISR